MFDIAWSELLIVVLIALVVYKPDDLPGALYKLGKIMRKARHYTGAVQRAFDDIVKEEEIREITRDLNQVGANDISSNTRNQLAAEQKKQNTAPNMTDADIEAEMEDDMAYASDSGAMPSTSIDTAPPQAADQPRPDAKDRQNV